MLMLKENGVSVVRNQIAWLGHRNPDNRPAMLLKAICEDWAKPHGIVEKERAKELRERQKRIDKQRKDEDQQISATKKSRASRKRRLLSEWARTSNDNRKNLIQKAAAHQTSKILADLIRRQPADSDSPRVQVLDMLAIEVGLPPVTQIEQE